MISYFTGQFPILIVKERYLRRVEKKDSSDWKKKLKFRRMLPGSHVVI